MLGIRNDYIPNEVYTVSVDWCHFRQQSLLRNILPPLQIFICTDLSIPLAHSRVFLYIVFVNLLTNMWMVLKEALLFCFFLMHSHWYWRWKHLSKQSRLFTAKTMWKASAYILKVFLLVNEATNVKFKE